MQGWWAATRLHVWSRTPGSLPGLGRLSARVAATGRRCETGTVAADVSIAAPAPPARASAGLVAVMRARSRVCLCCVWRWEHG